MKNILISSFDMEVGGVERSLISMLDNFDYQNFEIDLFLYSQSGDLLDLIPRQVNLLPEKNEYKTIRLSIKEIFTRKMFLIAFARIFAKFRASLVRVKDSGYLQSQYIWQYCSPFFPSKVKEYDIAISYLWPHNFVANKVNAKTKIAWIHTDYSAISTNLKIDLLAWSQFDFIVSISTDCTKSFIKKYPSLKDKIVLIENITAPDFITKMSTKPLTNNIFCKENFNILSVGRLCYPKAFDKAVQALKLIHEQGFTNVKWYIIGYGPDEKLLRELISTNKIGKSFILLGKKSNPYPYIKACDIYVQPSRYEGKAVTVSEAKILAKPILITNYSTATSQITHKQDGIICGIEISDIAKNIIDLYKNKPLREQISSFCKKENYNNSNELDKLYNLINE